MKRARLSAALLLAIFTWAAHATGTDGIVASLRALPFYAATVDYQVLMSLQDDVAYSIALESAASPTDSLSPCDYIIEWRTPEKADDSLRGFAAYTGGNAYMFRGDRLLEYHFAEDPQQFTSGSRGVQRKAQFASLLPAFMADEIEEWVTNPNWEVAVKTDTIVDGRHMTTVTAMMSRDGDIGREVFYFFDRDTKLPLKTRIESNPGALAEQTILAEYHYAETPDSTPVINEAMLRDRYPTQFDTLRDSMFAIESLRGKPLPQLALPTTTAERYLHNRGDGFRAPTLLVLLEPTGAFTAATVKSIRSALDILPFNTDILWAFTSNNVDEIEAIIERPRPGEHTLMGARTLARDCGATSLPTIIFAGTDGIVSDFHQGFNHNLKEIVIEKATAIGH